MVLTQMTSPITRYIYQKSIYNSNKHQHTHSTTSQEQQDRINELINQTMPATISFIFTTTLLLIILFGGKFLKSLKNLNKEHQP